MKTTITCSVLTILIASTATALPLADMPERVGGYVNDDQGQPIEGALVSFTNQTTLDEYTGLSDINGWYGNLSFSAVPDVPSSKVLGSAYPNPFGNSTSIEIHSGSAIKSSGSVPQQIELFDLRGRLVGSVPAVSGTHQVNTTSAGNLPKGVYFYKLGDEVRRMVGNPKTLVIGVVSSDVGVGKALVQYRRVAEASGYVIQDDLINLDKQAINFASLNLVPSISSYSKPVAFQVRSIAGDHRQAIGEIVIRNASGTEFLALADVDSVYRTTVEVASESELLTIYPRGIAGFESMTYVILDPDSVAVRGWVGEGVVINYPVLTDTATVAFDHDALDKELFLEIVPEYRMVDEQYRQSVGVIFKRYYDRMVEILTNTWESECTVPAQWDAVNWLFQAEMTMENMFENTHDGIPLIESSVYLLPSPSGERENIVYRAIDNQYTPGNSGNDFSGDGFMDYHFAHIRDNDSVGIMAIEVANEFAHDLNTGNLGPLYDESSPIFQFNALGRDVAATWAKFSNGRNFNP